MEPIKENTILIPILRDDLVETCLKTLHKNTPDNFYVIVVDQSLKGIDKSIIDNYIHIYIRPHRNLGFAKAVSVGMNLCETKYFTTCNDDVEFVHPNWWQGVKDTFDKVAKATPDRPAALVTPSSIRLADWSVGNSNGDHHNIIPYKKEYTDEDWNNLLNEEHYVNEHLTIKPDTVIDGITMYCSVFDMDKTNEIGWLDEMHYPGGGEDYSWCCRANMMGYRSVGTTLSWVFHHWSKTLANQEDYHKLIEADRKWNRTDETWGPGFDLWGVKCPECNESMAAYGDKKFATCSKKHTQYKMPPVSKVML